MRILYIAGFLATITLTLAASARPSAAMVIYPWCVDYNGKFGAQNCGFTSFRQCLATASGNGSNCVPNAWYQPYPPPPTYSPPLQR
jgi:hypothetical protein